MENVEHTKVENTTTSSANTKQNDCFNNDDGDDEAAAEHVINQNQRLLDKLNTNANDLYLTESSSATTGETNERCCSPKQIEPEEQEATVEPVEHEQHTDESSSNEDEPAPVDLTNLNAKPTNSTNSELPQIMESPLSLKVDAIASENTLNDDLDIATPNDTLEPTIINNSLKDLHAVNNLGNQSLETVAEVAQTSDNSLNQLEAASVEAAVVVAESDKINAVSIEQPSESILDLSVNSVHEASNSPSNLETNQTYQRRLSEIKVEKALESQENAAFYPKEKQTTSEQSDEIIETAIKLNGSLRYSPPPAVNCEENFQNVKASLAEIESTNENNCEYVEEVEQGTNDVNMLNLNSTLLAERTAEQLSNCSFSNSAENLAVESSKTLEAAMEDAESTTNDLNESRYSSSDSLNSASTLQSSSSHQLIIDQPVEDEKVPPLRLKLKRKHRKSNSSVEESAQPTKRSNIEINSTENLSGGINLEEPTTVCHTLKAQMNEEELTENVLENSIPPNVAASVDDIEMAVNPSPPQSMQAMETAAIQNEIPIEMSERLLVDNNVADVANLEVLKPATPSQYYKCTACGTYHENWSFFLHLQEKHDRFLCLYCIKCFPTAEKLALHLEIKHDLEQNHFNTEEAFRNSAIIIHGFSVETRFLMCCTCQYIFRENAAFTEHVCIEFMKSCTLCGQKGRHTNQCKANPITKRRNKKKMREKQKPPSIEPPTQTEIMVKPPPPPVFTALETPAPQQQPQQMAQKTPVRRHTEDSNSSSNMVIDESCNTNHTLPPNQINPFKALDDTERMEQEEAARKQQEEAANAESLLNSVFKFKLRVPKEFQKPVDEEISTSESEHGEVFEDEAADINSNQIEFKNNVLEESKTTMTMTTPPPAPCIAEQQTNIEASMQQSEEDESVDDMTANAHLARILQEIEQTKLDIEKTKETLHQRHVPPQMKAENESAEGNSEMVVDKSNVNDAEADVHWTPTPPASPNLNVDEVFDKPNDLPPPIELNLETEAETQHEITQLATENMDVADISNDNALPLVDDTPTVDLPTNDSTINAEIVPAPPDDGIEVANEDCLQVELQLDRPLDQFETVEFVRICLKAAYPYCLYCNHARRIAVNAESLVLHLIAQHRFRATVDSITAEELLPSTIVARLKSFLPALQDQFMNSSSYCTIGEGLYTRHFNERIFECFQCRFVTSTHKELYLHNRKMHLRTAILCFMCRCNFYSFSEILCHICPGIPHRVSIFEIKFRCCLCELTEIPSPFRLMVHLRKRHFACDICLEDCRDQSKLSSHVWKHKLHHLCYRCGIAYRNKLDITKHLFWKHGTESTICKRCLQKRWPHVYHFCVPPAIFSCDVCQLCFSKAMYLTVHKRLHQNDFRYACTEADCQEKFISRKLLLKHSLKHEVPEIIKNEHDLSEDVKQKTVPNDDDMENEEEKKPALMEEKSEQLNVEAKVEKAAEVIKAENEELAEKAEVAEEQPKSPNTTPIKAVDAAPPNEQPSNEKKHKKRKKRAKESLEDLNLTAPNLSESGSSSESESETKSTTTNTRHELALSPLSEHGDSKAPEQATDEMQALDGNVKGNVLDIWKNFLQSQQSQSGEQQQYAEYTADNYPAPKSLHVCISDHDYCHMFPKPQTEVGQVSQPQKTPTKENQASARTASSSSDASSDDSSSSSSCSCGSNCSCSNGSSSSSSSGDTSDSSVSVSKKRLRKKSERSNRHRKSFSSSPMKQQQQQQQAAHNTSGDNVNVIDTDDNANISQQLQDEANAQADEVKTNLEPTINESDLETAESETDEEYYDEHPQKLATELLSQKRAQLMARTLLSPSHNFDIVENSRPSTPSLPEDVIYEKRQKKKKNKRDRKSTSNNKMLASIVAASAEIGESPEYETIAASTAEQHNSSSTMVPLMAPAPIEHHYNHNQLSGYMENPQPRLPPSIVNHHMPRMSEGSSCSDADYSLKRSKRQRRPNKFYGYTSDDESMAPATLGQSLVIGMRAYKPLPPPQLVWDKEDLPTPEKSILNVNKKTSRESSSAHITTDEHLTKKKKSTTHRKRSGQHSQKLPPIPRLKIRSALFNKSNEARDLGLEDSSDSASASSDIEQHAMPPLRKRTFPPKQSTTASSLLLPRYPPNQLPQQQQQQLPQQLPVAPPAAVQFAAPPPAALPPTPQTTAFNHKIPPALLPNPDFATLQYFKANNIRYPIRPPAGARAARDGESVYCYCRCPYDEVSEMIACDGDSCLIEWFHFECVGIMLAPQGKWFCAECRPQYSEELYPTTTAAAATATNTAPNF